MTTNFLQSSAYELADNLDETEPYYSTDYKLFDNAANMLRQQAHKLNKYELRNQEQIKRIAELEKQLQESAMHNISVTAQADEHYARVKELEKQITKWEEINDRQTRSIRNKEKQSEPVAWIEPDVIPLTHIIKAVVRREQDEQYSIPLYTTPHHASDVKQTKLLSDDYKKTHEGFSTIQEVIAKHEAIPNRKEAIDKAREWLKDYPIEAIFAEPFTKPLSDEEIAEIYTEIPARPLTNGDVYLLYDFARAIESKLRGQ